VELKISMADTNDLNNTYKALCAEKHAVVEKYQNQRT